MISANLKNLENKAGEMAIKNIWGDNAYKINMAILKADSNNGAACTRLAKYYKLNDNEEEAKNMYMKALLINPANQGAINNLQDIEKQKNDNETVEKITSVSELLKQGRSCMLKGRYQLSAKLCIKAYEMDPSISSALALALVYKKMGKFDSIENLYNQHLQTSAGEEDSQAITEEFKLFRRTAKVLAE